MRTEDQLKEVCKDAGVEYVGIQEVSKPGEQLVLFNDPITGTTLTVKTKEFTNPRVQAKIAVHRKKYGKNITLLSDIFDAIRFLANRNNIIPREVIMQSAHAALLPIKLFLEEAKKGK
jgi:hypothetical protein